MADKQTQEWYAKGWLHHGYAVCFEQDNMCTVLAVTFDAIGERLQSKLLKHTVFPNRIAQWPGINVYQIDADICMAILREQLPLSQALLHLDPWPEDHASYDSWDRYPAWLNVYERSRLRHLAAAVPVGGQIVEVGSYVGGSALLMADASSPDVQITCIDAKWKLGQAVWHFHRAQLKCSNDTKTIEIANQLLNGRSNISMIAADSPKDMQEWITPVNLVFEDSCHSDPGFTENLDFWTQKLVHGGVMAGHDYATEYPNIMSAVNALAQEWQTEIHLHGTLWSLHKP